jgi:SAM-dependent methyltransferase
MTTAPSLQRHDEEMLENRARWLAKPLLREIYRDFHRRIAAHLAPAVPGETVELGSGMGSITEVIPHCVRTDLVPHPWIDRVENAYRLSVPDASLANLILFDVFHHLRYPGTALDEARRALVPGGRLILFEPCISALGAVVYGLCHHEPVAWRAPIVWRAPAGWHPGLDTYYAAQGNATRLFFGAGETPDLRGWRLVHRSRLPALAYVASGGFRRRALYPARALPLLRALERLCRPLPGLFATRCLVVLEKG